jgi:hypothetical protein
LIAAISKQGEEWILMKKLFRGIQRTIPLAGFIAFVIILAACGGGQSNPIPPAQPSQPDLAFTGSYDFIYERTLSPTGNDLYTFVVDVRNQGSAPANDVQIVAHYKGPGIEGDMEALDNAGYYSIGAGETVKARFQFIYEKPFSGNYDFTVTVDPANSIQEEDESNNRFAFNRTF